MTLRTWLPAVLWTAIIALESGFGSGRNTAPVLQQIAFWLFGDMDPARFEFMHHAARKTGHFLGYGILGYLWFRAFTRVINSTQASTGLAIACTFVIACLDEWHQSFLPDRSGQFSDVVLDTCGALLLVSFAMVLSVRRPMKNAASG